MKNLLFTSAGDNTNFDELWLDKDRNYDVWVVYYGNNDENFERYKSKVDYIIKRKGDKWQNFHHVYNIHYNKIQEYDRIFFLDDDIIITVEDINKMFQLSLECDLWICQPSFALGSEIGWGINVHNSKTFLRYTNFIENNSCLMTKEALNNFMKLYSPELVSFGVDYVFMWANEFSKKENNKKFAIIDIIQCINPPGELKSKGKITSKTIKSFQKKYKSYSKKYWPNNDITNGKGNREFSKLENNENRKKIWKEFSTKHNIPQYPPKVLKEVVNKTQQIEHAKSNYSPFTDVKFDKTIKFEKNDKDKIAFLFLTRNNLKQPQLWYDFLSEGNGKCNMYAHSKERDKLNQQFLIDHQIPEHIHTEWGHSNLLTATNALIKNALKDPTNKRFVLVSESCIPLYFFEVIYYLLFTAPSTSGKSFLYTKITPTTKKQHHIKMKDAAYIQVCRNGDPSKELGITWENMTRNSQWMILNKPHAEIINKHNYEHLWKNFNVADEWYYYNVLRYHDPNIEKNTITYIKPTWFGTNLPYLKTLTEKEKKQFVQSHSKNPEAHPAEYSSKESILNQRVEHPSFFFRKVNEHLKIDYKDLKFIPPK